MLGEHCVTDIFSEAPATPTTTRSTSRNILQVIWQRRWLALLGLCVGFALGLLAYSQRPPVYRASAQVLVVKKQTANALPVAGGDPRVTIVEDYVSTHLVLVRSPLVVERAVKKRNLGSLKSFQGGDAVGGILAGLSATRETGKDTPSRSNNTIIILTFSGPDSAEVETVLLAVIESYREFLDETYRDFSDATVQLITAATETLQTSLTAKELAYRNFRIASPLMVKGESGVNIHASRILDLQRKESVFLERASEIRKRLEAIEQAKKDGKSRSVILALAARQLDKGQPAENNEAALETALLPLFKQEAELTQFYGEDHPDVLRIRQQMELTKDFYRRLDEIVAKGEKRSSKADPLESAIQTLREEQVLVDANHASLKALLAGEVVNARELEKYEIQDEGHRSDISRTTKVLDQTLKRLEEINLIHGYGGFEARTIAPPTPGGKVSPVFLQFVLMGAALGLGFGAGAAYLLDMADKSFRTPEEIRRRLGLPIVGHVPFSLKPAGPARITDRLGQLAEIESGIVAFHSTTSHEAEAFRGIRTALYFNTHGERHKVIQVTSPNMGDGKTTLVCNLAVSIAQSGRTVLIIDADMRRPRVHRAFGLAGKIGLAELIEGKADLAAAVQPTVVANLSVLPCGRRPTNPAELLTSPRFEDILDDARQAYDFVLVDTPPLLAVSDPCIVAPRVDGLLLTIRVSKNGRPAAERARDLLTGLKINCLGVVVNGVGKHGSMTGYGYDQYHYDHYHYTDDYASQHASNADDPVSEENPIDRPLPSANGTGLTPRSVRSSHP